MVRNGQFQGHSVCMLYNRDNTLIGHCKGLAVPMDSQFQTGEAFQDLVELDKHNPELSLVLQGYYLSLYST